MSYSCSCVIGSENENGAGEISNCVLNGAIKRQMEPLRQALIILKVIEDIFWSAFIKNLFLLKSFLATKIF